VSGVAGLHRASPSAALDKSAACGIPLSFPSENLYLIIRDSPEFRQHSFFKKCVPEDALSTAGKVECVESPADPPGE